MIQKDRIIFLKDLKGLILDVDGVLFSGHESRMCLPDGGVAIMKTRSHKDGQGLSFLRALGIKIVFATGEGQPINSVVEKLNSLPSVLSGEWDRVSLFTNELKKAGKVKSIEAWLEINGLAWDECAYIGDDRTDLEAMQLAGLKVTPANATRVALEVADLVLSKEGGDGAIREFAEMILDARGIKESSLPSA